MSPRQDLPLADRDLTDPHPSRFAPEHPRRADVLAAHEAAMAAGEALYRDPDSGLWVMTASFLSERGWCCGNGCRHCPYVV